MVSVKQKVMSYFKQGQTLIIADAGKNWLLKEDYDVNQCLNEAKSLVFHAKRVGFDVVKFQTHVFWDEYKKRSKERYDWINLNEKLTPYKDFWVPLKAYCDELEIKFMTTPMSKMAAQKISDLVEVWKIGSADIVDQDLIDYVISTKKPVIISSGMSTLEEVDNVTNKLKQAGVDLLLNHCVSIYPCPVNKLNLHSISYLRNRYTREVPIGFSDHSLSVKVPAMAVRLGAQAIEKHLTLDRTGFGPDHKASLIPVEAKEMIKLIRDADLELYAYGKPGFVLHEEEKDYWSAFRV